MIWKEVLKGYLWRQRSEEMVVLEKLVGFPLKGQASEKEIKTFLNDLGFRIKEGEDEEGEYFRGCYFTEKAIGKLAKRRLAFSCGFCDFQGYVVLKWYEYLKEGSGTIIACKGDRSGEKDRICYCPNCDKLSVRVHFDPKLDPWKLTKKVPFTAKSDKESNEKSTSSDLDGGGLYKGKW